VRKKIVYGICTLAVTCSMMFLSRALPIQAQTPSDQPLSDQFKKANKSSFVYIITNPDGPNAVSAYSRNPRNGKLKFVTSYPTGGQGDGAVEGISQHSLVTDGSYIYAVNAGSNDISAFSIQKDGSLQLVGSPVNSGGLSPVTIAVHNNLLYVANQGDSDTPANLVGFTVNNGLLQSLSGSTIALNFNDDPGDVLFNKAGNLLIDTRIGGDIIDTYQVDSNGRLKRITRLTEQPGAFGAAFNPVNDQQLFVGLSGAASNATYLVSNEGQISPINSVTDFAIADPCWLVLSKDGKYAWSTGFIDSLISLYKVDANGTLSLISSDITEDIGRFSTDLALSSDGKYLYQSKPLPTKPIINVLRVSQSLTSNTKNAGLEEVETIDVPLGSNPIGLVVTDLTEEK
jgi:6-phosphogluconolactonase